jgi:hypothetical protein
LIGVSVTPIYDELRARSHATGFGVPRARRRPASEDTVPGEGVVRPLASRPGLGGRHRKPLNGD